jgi:ribosomal protein S16
MIRMNLRNIESAKIFHPKSAKQRNSNMNQNSSSYYQMHRSYNKHFTYNPTLLECQRSKSPLTNERCKTATQNGPKMSRKEQQLTEESNIAIKMIKQKLRDKRAVINNKNKYKDKDKDIGVSKKQLMDFRRQSLKTFLDTKSIFDKS